MREGSLRLRVAAVMLLALAATSCGAGDGLPEAVASGTQPSVRASPTLPPTPPATATTRPSTLDDAGLPRGAVGPLLLYVNYPGTTTNSTGPGQPPPEVVVWDAGTSAEIARFGIGGPNAVPGETRLAGSSVLVTFGHGVERYALDGTHEVIFEAPDGWFITEIQVDAAGEVLVASTEIDLGGPVRLWWVDARLGTVLKEARPITDQASFGRALPRLVGSGGSPLLLRGVTFSRSPGGYAILEGDVPLLPLPVAGAVTPSADGAALAHGLGDACGLISGPRLELLDVATRSPLATYEEPGALLVPWEWSPDGSEFAFRAFPTAEGSECPDLEASPRWLLLGTDGSIREAPSGLALRSEWSGELAVTFSCTVGDDAGWRHRDDGLQRPDSCAALESSIELAGTVVGTAEHPTILGLIEVPASP